MTSIYRLLLPAMLGTLPLVANAETFVLKDGKRLEGRIVEETATDYLVEIQVTPTIKDQRRVSKQDVSSVLRPDPATGAFDEIQKATPVPDNSSVEQYDALLDTKILPFLKNFPKSPKAKEVAQLREEVTLERNLVASGGIKLNGSTYSAADREANAFDIDAWLTASDIRAKAQRGEFTGALRAFETFERDFSSSTHYRETAQLTERILGSYREGIQQDLVELDSRVAARALGLTRIPVEEQRRSQYLIDEENKSYLALVEREKAGKTQWPSLNPYHPEPMRATLATIAANLTRLKATDLDEIIDGGMAFRSAWRNASQPTEEEEFKTVLANLRAAKVPERYIERVVQRAQLTQATTPVAPPAIQSEPTDPANPAVDTPADNTTAPADNETHQGEMPPPAGSAPPAPEAPAAPAK